MQNSDVQEAEVQHHVETLNRSIQGTCNGEQNHDNNNVVVSPDVLAIQPTVDKQIVGGSNKGIEPDMACSMTQRLDNDGYTVGTVHADNGATTQSRLHRENNFAYSDVLDKIGHIKLCVCKNVRLVMGSKGRDSRKRTRGPVLDSNNPNKSSTELRDGASVMTGMRSGVTITFSEQNFFIIKTHSIAHRLPSESSQAANSINYLKKKQGSLNEKKGNVSSCQAFGKNASEDDVLDFSLNVLEIKPIVDVLIKREEKTSDYFACVISSAVNISFFYIQVVEFINGEPYIFILKDMKGSELKQWPDKADLSLVEPSIITDILNCQKLFKMAEDFCSNSIEYG
ncbi:Hypothetical predicted protein [Mytilus galloprovincialis]|uniref:Uncharacterized protein n=1 Tax=Mytilus galloprovincialis TaxID=29158 RepID=A0A8B6EXM5_MYTGA|nr:Hypothetical predicted protein [Mytilus galloprovincialis]